MNSTTGFSGHLPRSSSSCTHHGHLFPDDGRHPSSNGYDCCSVDPPTESENETAKEPPAILSALRSLPKDQSINNRFKELEASFKHLRSCVFFYRYQRYHYPQSTVLSFLPVHRFRLNPLFLPRVLGLRSCVFVVAPLRLRYVCATSTPLGCRVSYSLVSCLDGVPRPDPRGSIVSVCVV